MGRVIGIDYGTKRTGLATTDPLKIICNGLTTVDTKEIIPFLKEYCLKNDVEAFVVGYPLNFNLTETNATQPVIQFIDKLKKQFPNKAVYTEDERLTSKMAVRTMIDGGIKKMKRRDKSLVDKVSATLILQSFMENYTV